MTLREAAQQALKSMDDHMYRADTHEFYEAKEALRAALAEPAEPVAQYSDIASDGGLDPRNKFDTAPTPRKPLTQEQFESAWYRVTGMILPEEYKRLAHQARHVTEAAHGIIGDNK